MKSRAGFVSNSSSTSFIITNRSDKVKTMLDFVREVEYLIDDYNTEYEFPEGSYGYVTLEDVLRDARSDNTLFEPNSPIELMFGDEDGTNIGKVFDYMLREGGTTKSFRWRFSEYHR